MKWFVSFSNIVFLLVFGVGALLFGFYSVKCFMAGQISYVIACTLMALLSVVLFVDSVVELKKGEDL